MLVFRFKVCLENGWKWLEVGGLFVVIALVLVLDFNRPQSSAYFPGVYI